MCPEGTTMKVACDVEEVELEGDCAPVPSVCVTCTRCDHCVESYGTTDASVRRSLAVMREECPRGENNFYTA
jgi:hypothetical protein